MGCVTSCLSSTYYYFKESFFCHRNSYDIYDEGISLINQENEENNRIFMLNAIKKDDKQIIIKIDDEIEQEDNNYLNVANNNINSYSFDKAISSFSDTTKGSDSHTHTRSNKSKSHSSDDTSTEKNPQLPDRIYEKYKCDGCGNYMLGKNKIIIHEVGEINDIILCKYCNILYNMNTTEMNEIEEDILPPNTPSQIYNNNNNNNNVLKRNDNDNNDYDDLQNIENNEKIEVLDKIEEDDYENDDYENEVSNIFPSKRKRNKEKEKGEENEDERIFQSKKKRNGKENNPQKLITVNDERFNILCDYEDAKYIFEKLCEIRCECSKCKNIYSSILLFKNIDNNWICINCRSMVYIADIFDWTFKSKCGMIECTGCGNLRDAWKFYSITKTGKSKNQPTATCLHCRNLRRNKIKTSVSEDIKLDGSEMVKCCFTEEHDCRIIDCVKYEEKYICKECAKVLKVDYKQLKPVIGIARYGILCNECNKIFPNWYFDGKKTCCCCRIRQNVRNYIKRSQNKDNSSI